jgi:outer membrane usher protein FimD/PapC
MAAAWRRYEDQLAYQAWYRRGLSDWFTLGGRVEGDEFVRNGGLDAAVARRSANSRSPSRQRSRCPRSWHAHAINYAFNMSTWSIGLGSRRVSADYRTMSDPLDDLYGALRIDDYASSRSRRKAACRCNSMPAQQRQFRPLERTWGITVRCARGIAVRCSSRRSAVNRTCSKTPRSS